MEPHTHAQTHNLREACTQPKSKRQEPQHPTRHWNNKSSYTHWRRLVKTKIGAQATTVMTTNVHKGTIQRMHKRLDIKSANQPASQPARAS